MSWGVFNCTSRGEGEGMIDEKHVLGGFSCMSRGESEGMIDEKHVLGGV